MSIIAIKRISGRSKYITPGKIYPIIGKNYKIINDMGNEDRFFFPGSDLIGLTFIDIWKLKRQNKWL